jgi:ribonuclease J
MIKNNLDDLKILPLGGSDRVTKNLFVYEWQNHRLIVDCGIGFPEEEMLGVDLLIPDVSYLLKNPKNIEGIVLTHGHDDHIASLVYILPQLGQNIPVYGSKLTIGFVKDTLKDFKLKASLNVVKESDQLKLGPFTVQPIHVTHSVPDTFHLAINTPAGTIYHGADFKFDLTPVDSWGSNFQKIAKIGQQGVKCLLSDCLRVERPGFSQSESTIKDNLIREIRGCQGRFILTTISSNLHRIQQAIDVAASFGRKIAFIGRSIERNIKTAEQLGFLHLPKKAIISRRSLNKYPRRKLAIFIAGSQGQAGSSLVRVANDEHAFVRVEPSDKVVFSSDPIPGNEKSVYRTIDQFLRLGVEVVYSEVTDDLHVSGHGSQGDLKLLMGLTKPEYMIPIGGEFRHLHFYRNLAQTMGYKKDQIFILKDGQSVNLSNSGEPYIKHEVDLKDIFVDGSRIGDVGPVVLADRQKLSEEGIVMVTIPYNQQTKKAIGDPQVVSRGFVFMKQSAKLIDEAKTIIKSHYGQSINDQVQYKQQIEHKLHQLFVQKTGRKPLILCVLVKV